jgi:hypothetical protein
MRNLGFISRSFAQRGSFDGDDTAFVAPSTRVRPAEPATPPEVADPWIDELQWAAGFPTSWGERRATWFCGY